MTMMGILLALVLAVVLGRVLWNRRPRARRRAAMRDLLLYCEGDQDLAERLLWQEMKGDPDMDFAMAARRAIQRLRRDRR